MPERAISGTGLETDLYHVDSAFVAWQAGITGQATFDLYTRSAPFGGIWMLVAGIAPAIEFAAGFRYAADDITWLKSVRPYPDAFWNDLATTRFTGEIMAMTEGEIAFPGEPILRVTAPFHEALLLESGLLHNVGIATLLATKAARVVLAANGKAVSEFAFRRAQAPWIVARSAWIAGCRSTSFLAAGRELDLPVSGTIPHALVQAFPTERKAFLAVAQAMDRYTLLLDTYDVHKSIDIAISVSRQAQTDWGHKLAAVRLDSGDIAADARFCREALDQAGLTDVQILASGDLDEFGIAELEKSGAPIDAYGVGTSLGVGAGSLEHGVAGGALGAVYKLVWYDADSNGSASAEEAPIKIAGAKSTWPGRKQVSRLPGFAGDLLHLESESVDAAYRPLLSPVMRDGSAVHETIGTLAEARERAAASLEDLPSEYRALLDAPVYPLINSSALLELRNEAMNRKRQG